jgi:hypothetical protein
MSTPVFGSYSFANTPDVNGTPVLLNGGNTPQITSGIFSALPAAGNVGNVYITTDTNLIYRDNGASWILLSAGVPVVGSGQPIQQTFSNIAATTGTSTITLANTTPTTAMGTQIWSHTITPTYTTSNVNISGAFCYSLSTTSRQLTAAFFRGSTCIGVVGASISTTTLIYTLPFNFIDTPGSTSTQTYSIRVGISNGTGTWYIGQTGTTGNNFNGMLAKSGVTVSELA